ncbi:YceH family protein [Accumulibacter sp.]|uniref:YceH family protein n=1 Tax=Accumulibacter sp. TaxID=2053492 RepID=UPI0026025389|nr:YceH family protein [Accumulibacter sp.]
MADNQATLSFLEARILGVLIEKEKTTPDAYPLTLNSLTAGCNQKSARDPVTSVIDSEVQAALEDLRGRILVLETYGASGRVLRYAQNFGRVYGVPAASVALLAILVLRGPQTISELRANSERLYRFDDASSVEAYLEELATRSSGPLVTRLPRQAGAREQRWAHLLCGAAALPTEAARRQTVQEDTGLEERVARLELEVAELRAAIGLASR